MSIGHYLKSMAQLTNQFTPSNFRDPRRQRLYLKDIDCPEDWARELKELIPETFYYLNDCIEPRTGGDGAVLEANEYGQMKYGKGVAPAGDLMSSLPPEMRALNMMCYIGHEGTYTPAHREMCASLGHNIMVEASQDGNGEKAGSSIWFMTETKEREVVSEYFLSMLGHDIEVERHFAQVNAWKKAPFNVWVVEQRPGDLILIPPLAPHQVWNRGTRTMKAAWNRTTVDTLELALHEALPRARLVCREEQYKNKAIVYYTLVKYHALLQRDTIEPKMWKYGRIKQLLEDFKRLFALYTEILVSEMFASILPPEKKVEFLPFDSNVTCSYCRCNIFNRFLTCKTCIETGPTGEEDAYDICMECYAMGRSCYCMSNLNWVEQWDWSGLTQKYEEWRNVIVQCDGYFDAQKSPQPLDIARKRYGRKPVAHICQEQLKVRPWHDITKPFASDPFPGESDVEPEAEDDGGRRKKKPARTQRRGVIRTKNKTWNCHICFHHDWNWRLAFCTTCNSAYCYGVLWRAFDLMPQTVMEDRDWSCPKCQGICSCARCRKDKNQTGYAPKGTLLGHDTRKVADARSVESLVDFSKTNLTWLRGENDHNPQESARMKRLREKAEEAKAREDVIDENYFDDHEQQMTHGDARLEGDDRIDPALLGPAASLASHESSHGHYESPYPPVGPTTSTSASTSFTAPWQDVSETSIENGFDTSQRPEIGYPSALLGPVDDMQPSPNQADPKQAHLGQNRMMGVGFYKQDNGVDKILYHPPNLNGAAAQNTTISTTANFAFSDIVPPPLQDEEPKKRKYGSENDGEGKDTEFFASKRQKKLAGGKKPRRVQGEELSSQPANKSTPSQRPSRASAGKPNSYVDSGADGVLLSESETIEVSSKPKAGPDEGSDTGPVKKPPGRRRRPNAANTQVSKKSRLAQESTSTATPPVAKPARGRSAWVARNDPQEQETSSTETPPVAQPTKEKSTWLARNDTHDTGGDELAAPPRKRGRPPKSSVKPKPQMTPFNDDVEGNDDLYNDSDAEQEVLQVVEDLPKRNSPKQNRNMTPKNDAATSKPTGQTRLLSLKEKLAETGMSAKIVASKQRRPVATLSDSTKSRSSLSAVEIPQANSAQKADTSLSTRLAASGSPKGRSSLSAVEIPQAKSAAREAGPGFSDFAPPDPAKLLNRKPPTPPPARKGPTVVRLSTPSDELDESETYGSDMSSSGDDSSIPAVARN